MLRSSDGNYAASITGCPSTGNVLPIASALDDPDPGKATFYIARAVHDEIGTGSYDTTGTSQISRYGGRDSGDEGIQQSPQSCPLP